MHKSHYISWTLDEKLTFHDPNMHNNIIMPSFHGFVESGISVHVISAPMVATDGQHLVQWEFI